MCAIIVLAFLGAGWHVRATGQLPFLKRTNIWSIAVYEGTTPFDLLPIQQPNVPVLTHQDVTDVDALFVADPFMIQDGAEWYMFFEVFNIETNQGDIGLARSSNGTQWQYQRVVLDESHHLSYPFVFAAGEDWYMLPQSDTGVHLYRATRFPSDWVKQNSILIDSHWADPTVFFHENCWWLFAGRSGTHDQLHLFSATDLQGDWMEHPQSPIVRDDAKSARPGGRVFKYQDRLYRLGQDCVPKYGIELRAYRISRLTTSEYLEEAVDLPIVSRGVDGWNSAGMHHCDAHQMPTGKWRAVVDGHQKKWMLQAKP